MDWANPNYDEIYTERAERLKRIRADASVLAGLKEYYKTHPADFIDDWTMTFDPRNAEIGLPPVMPFKLFPKQREFIEWLYERWRGRDDGLCDKSRDVGASWLCVGFAVWMWIFHSGTVVGFGSRKEDYVDKIGDPKSLFWKAREMIKLLPKEFRPFNYEAPFMRIVNHDNGSAIVGEAGDNIGRGNRTSIYFKDESAFYERPEAIDAALSQTSNCKIDISTPNGAGNPFHRKRFSGKISVFTLHWRDDPRKGLEWYQKQVEKLDSVIVAQEIDINYDASVVDAWIPGQLVAAAQRNGPADVEAIGRWIVAVDAAHQGNDESVIHCRKGRLHQPQIICKGIDGIQLAGRVTEICRALELGKDKVAGIVIELDGPGVSCYDQLKAGSYANVVNGVHTGARVSDDRNFNIRAKLWRKGKEHLESPPVSLHHDTELAAQLSSVRYKYKDGLLLMEDKKEYKKRMGKSPDRADAYILSFHEIHDDWSTPIKYKNFGTA